MFIEKIKSKFSDKNLYFIALINIIFWGIYIKMEFATDSYRVFVVGIRETATHFMACGRFVTAFFALFVHFFKFTHTAVYMLSYFSAVVCFTISMYKLFSIINKDIKKDWISILLSTLIILNIFSLELFMFIEKGVMAFSILCIVFAIDYFIKFIEDNKKKYIISSIVFMLFANFSYQGTIALFVAIAMIYVIKYSKNIQQFFKNNVLMAVVYVIPAFINFITVRFMFKNSRVDGQYCFTESLTKVFESTDDMLKNTFGIIPKYLYVSLLAITIFAMVLYIIINKKQSAKIKTVNIFYILYIILGVVISTIAPQMLQNTSSIWFVPRSTYAFASLLGILILFFMLSYKVTNKYFEKIFIVGSLLFLLTQFYNFQKIAIDHYILNYEDKMVSIQINNIVSEYEKNTGNNVNKISIYRDMYPSYTYKNLFVNRDINIKAYFPEWSIVPSLSYYSNRKFEVIEPKDEYIEEFNKNDWEYFDKYQVKIEDDTLHLCLY